MGTASAALPVHRVGLRDGVRGLQAVQAPLEHPRQLWKRLGPLSTTQAEAKPWKRWIGAAHLTLLPLKQQGTG